MNGGFLLGEDMNEEGTPPIRRGTLKTPSIRPTERTLSRQDPELLVPHELLQVSGQKK